MFGKTRDLTDAFTNKYSTLTKKASNNNSELRQGTEKHLKHIFEFNPVRHFTFPYQQALTKRALIGR